MRPDCHISPIIAHRGASGYTPENTLTAFRKAKELGAHWVEFDVKLAGCGTPIIIHDETLDRTTNGKGMVLDHPYENIARLDSGSWYHPNFVGEKVPSLADTIMCLAEHDLQANIELKPCSGREEETAIKTIEVLQHYWPTQKPKPLLSCFDLATLRKAYQIAPEFPLAWLVTTPPDNWLSIIQEIPFVSINCDQSTLTAEIVQKILQNGLKVLSYTVNDVDRARDLFNWGVSAIFTSYPDRLATACIGLSNPVSSLPREARI